MKNRKYIAEYDRNSWASTGSGGITVRLENAKRFKSAGAAKAAITYVRKYRELNCPNILVEYEGQEPCIYEHCI